MRIPVKIVISSVLLLGLLVSPTLVFADSVESSTEPVSYDLETYGLDINTYNPINLSNVQQMQFASALAQTQTTYDTTDIYLLLNKIGQQLNGYGDVGVRSPNFWSMMYKTYVMLGVDDQVNSNFEMSGYNLYDLLFTLTYNMNGLGVSNGTVFGKLDTLISYNQQTSTILNQMQSLNWQSVGSFRGLTNSFNGSYLQNGVINPGTYYAYYNLANSYNFNRTEGYYQFFIPIQRQYMRDGYITDIQFVDYYSGYPNTEYSHYDYVYDSDNLRSGIMIYVRNYNIEDQNLLCVIKFRTTQALTYSSSAQLNGVKFLPFDSKDYQLLKIAFSMDDMVSAIQDLTFDAPDYRSVFNQMLSQLESINGYMPTFNSRLTNIHDYLSSINNRQNTYFTTWNSRFTNMHDYLYSIRDTNISISNDIGNLAEMYADDDMLAAKEASQPVIQETLDSFTGDGAGAAKVSDAAGMKGVSSSVRSGLDAGGSVSGATSVFSDNNHIWEWFSQTNYNNINGIPNNTRLLKSSSSAPDVPDFYSQNQEELQRLLRGGSYDR